MTIVRSLLVSLAFAAACRPQTQPTPRPRASERLFAFHSNPWVNLHHFLYQTARARLGLDAGRLNTSSTLADTAGISGLTASDRSAWDAALALYTATYARRDILFDTSMVRLTNALSDTPASAPSLGAGVDPELARALERAMPAYRAVWWPRHDAANRAWIRGVAPWLDQFGDSAAAIETRVFGTTWPSKPVYVDVVAYANWAGAYTTDDPGRIHASSLDTAQQNEGAFETLFHEALHTLARPMFDSLLTAAREQHKRLPRDPTHPFIFYTAGEVSRRLLPNYVPFAERSGLWERTNGMNGMRPLVVEYWTPWLDGRGSMTDALRHIVAALP